MTRHPFDAALHGGDDERERRLADLFCEYARRIEAGEEFDREEIRRLHPEVAAELLQDLESFEAIGAELAPTEPLGDMGDYTLRRRIGRGGMGVVYEAWENSMDRRVALKVLPPGIAADERALQRFVREAKTAGQLCHPNVVSVYAMGVKEQVPYYAMEFVEGETVAQIVVRMRASPPDAPTPFGHGRQEQTFYLDVARAFAEGSEGLQHAHSRGVVHRDVKPSNLILDTSAAPRPGMEDGAAGSGTGSGSGSSVEGIHAARLRILDFGLARLEGQESLSATGEVVGTPLYMSPEQARRKKVAVDHRTDIYSLGATLYEVLTLEPPFRGKDHEDTLSQIIGREPRPPRQLNPRVPRDLETIVLKCLRKEPAERYGTAEALSQDLRRFVRGDPIEARTQPGWDKLLRRAWQLRGRIAAVAVLALLAASVGSLVLGRASDMRRRAAQDYRDLVVRAAWEIEEARLSGTADDDRPSAIRPGWSYESLLSRPDGTPPDVGMPGRIRRKLETAISIFPDRPDAPYHLARALRIEGRPTAALAQVRELRSGHPGFLPAAILEAAILRESGRAEEAEEILVRAEASGAADPPGAGARIRASRARHAGDWQGAAAALEGLADEIRLHGEPYLGASIELRLEVTEALSEARAFHRAIESCVAARTLWPEALGPKLWLAKLYRQRGLPGDAAEADRIFRGVLEEAPEAERERTTLGIAEVCRSIPDLGLAVEWARRLPREPLRSVVLSSCLLEKQDFVEALVSARAACTADPEGPLANFILANALRANDRRSEAVEHAERALRLGLEETTGARVGLPALNIAERFGDAADEAARLIGSEPNDPSMYLVLGVALEGLGRSTEARDLYRAALGRFPRNENLRLNLARLCMKRGEWEEAAREFERVLDRYPSDANAASMLAWVLCRLGRVEEGLALCGELRKLGSRIPSVHAYLGRVLLDAGLPDDSIREFEEASRLDPAQAWPAASIADVRARQGRLAEAEAAFREALGAVLTGILYGPGEYEVRHQLAVVLLREGRVEEAIAELDGAAAASPPGPNAPWLAGRLLAARGRPDQAFDSFAKGLERDPGHPEILDAVCRFLRRSGAGLDLSTRWDRLAAEAERRLRSSSAEADDSREARVLHLLATCERHGVVRRDLGKAREHALSALEKTRRRDPEILATLADLDALAGQAAAAVRGIEEALGLDGADRILETSLGAYRRAALPDLPSFASVDAALAGPGGSVEGAEGILVDYRPVAEGEEGARRLLYLEGRILEEQGAVGKAIAAYSRALEAGAPAPEVLSRLAGCLRRSGKAREAVEVLRGALAGPLAEERALWVAWLSSCVDGVGLTPGAVAELLPRGVAPGEESGGESRPGTEAEPRVGSRADMAWLLESLAAGTGIRIRCGDDRERLDASGRLWGEDRFFLGGVPSEPLAGSSAEIRGTDDPALYRTQRWFWPEGSRAGYAIPLPRGRYGIVLHFCEIWFAAPSLRRFDVRIEGEEVLRGYEPLSVGFCMADARSFEADVRDGVLDIELVPDIDVPAIAGIEVEPRPSDGNE